MDKDPMVQSSAAVESIDSITSKGSKMDNISLPSTNVVQPEQARIDKGEGITMTAPIMQSTSKQKEKSTPEPLPINKEIKVTAPIMQPASNQNKKSTPKPLPNAATSSSANAEKSMLTIILDLNGLLLKRSPQPSLHHKSVQLSSNRYIILRPGCIPFLKKILQRFNVAVWSTASRPNVLQILRELDKLAGEALPFFTAWFQEGCHIAQSQKLFRPDNPNVEAMFKPLAKIAMGFECDPQRTVLIDDSPYKGSISPANNCIFPSQFDSGKIVDNVLLEELLPYLLKLDETKDVRELIASNRYGQPPLTSESEYKEIIEYWKQKNDVWSAKVFLTKRISPVKYDKGEAIVEDKLDESSAMSHQSRMKRAQIQEILNKEGTPIEMMKPAQLTALARQLGCSLKGQLKATTAKAYINKVKADNNLLTLDKKHA